MKEVDFLFEYEVRNREIDSVCLLGAYLESKGYRIGYVNSWDSLFHLRKEYNTKVMVLSAAYNNATYEYFTSHAEDFQKVVNLQWEQVLVNSIVYGNEKTSWDYSGIALTTRHICWGEDNKEYLQKKFDIDGSYLRVCGYLPLDFYRKEFLISSSEKDRLFKKYGLATDKRTILFVSSFSGVGLPKSEEAIGEDEQKEISKRIQYDSQEKIVEWLVKFGREHADYQIVYRPHPAEASNPVLLEKARKEESFHVIPYESIRNWIQACDILCNWQSTSMIEMYAAQKKTLLLRPVEIPFEFEMPIFKEGKYQAIHSYTEFEESVMNPDSGDFPIPKEDLLYFYDIQDKPTYERIGDYLIETLEDDNYHSQNRNHRVRRIKKIAHIAELRGRAFAADMAFKLTGGKKTETDGKDSKREKITENYTHYQYFRQKMKENRITDKELREKIETYKKIISDSQGE